MLWVSSWLFWISLENLTKMQIINGPFAVNNFAAAINTSHPRVRIAELFVSILPQRQHERPESIGPGMGKYLLCLTNILSKYTWFKYLLLRCLLHSGGSYGWFKVALKDYSNTKGPSYTISQTFCFLVFWSPAMASKGDVFKILRPVFEVRGQYCSLRFVVLGKKLYCFQYSLFQ